MLPSSTIKETPLPSRSLREEGVGCSVETAGEREICLGQILITHVPDITAFNGTHIAIVMAAQICKHNVSRIK